MALSKIDIENMVTGELTTTNGGTGATSFTTGISSASQWRLNTNFTGDAKPITSNWELNDTSGYGSLGSNMTESSGIFTFPSTGYYRVTFHHQFSGMVSGSNSNYVQHAIQYTADNSSYDDATEQWGQIFQNGSYNMATSSKIFDITNTSNQKVRFSTTSQGNNIYTQCHSTKNITYATFIKLGAT